MAGAATSIIYVATKILSRQTRLSRQNTSFVAIKVFLSRQNFCHHIHIFVTTKLLSWQAYFSSIIGRSCHEYNFRRDKHVFVATEVCLSRQNVLRVHIFFNMIQTQEMFLNMFVLDLYCVCARLVLCVRGRLVVCAWLVPNVHARLVPDLYCVFVLTKHVFCREKSMLVAMKLSR